MKLFLLKVLTAFLILTPLAAQNCMGQKLELSVRPGIFSVRQQKDFPRPQDGYNLNIGMDYHISDQWMIGTNYNLGFFSYYNPPLTNIYNPLNINLDYTRKGNVQQEHFSFLVSRKLSLPWFSLKLEVGTGIGMYLQLNEYYAGANYNPETGLYRGVNWVRDRNRGMHIPLQYSLKKYIYPRISTGVSGGYFFNHRLNSIGGYFGASLGYVF